MHSELFSLFGLHIQMYGVMLALGFAACYLLAQLLARKTGRNPKEVDTLVMVSALCGVIGARAVYVWQNWAAEFAEAPLTLFALWRGGLVFYGGFILATLGLILYARLKGERTVDFLGFCVVFVPLGHAFGRIGCFFHGCCFGGPCDTLLGVRYPAQSPVWFHQVAHKVISRHAPFTLPVWPTQFIEAAGCLLLFGLLWFTYLHTAPRRRASLCCGLYCTLYAALRYLVELLRDDPRGATLCGLSFSQILSLGLFAAGLAFLVIAHREKKNGPVHR